MDYLHDNLRRKGLVLEAAAWRFLSAAYWLDGVAGKSDVGLTAVGWRWWLCGTVWRAAIRG